MCTINLKDIMSKQSLPEAGSSLFEIMMLKLQKEDHVVLDMDGVTSLPSIFLNMSLGRFIEDKGVELLKQKITFARISKGQAERLQEYIEKFE